MSEWPSAWGCEMCGAKHVQHGPDDYPLGWGSIGHGVVGISFCAKCRETKADRLFVAAEIRKLESVAMAGAFVQGQLLGHFAGCEWGVDGCGDTYCRFCSWDVGDEARTGQDHAPDCEHVRFMAALGGDVSEPKVPKRIYLGNEFWFRLQMFAYASLCEDWPVSLDGTEVVHHPFVRDWMVEYTDGTFGAPQSTGPRGEVEVFPKGGSK